jgi:hypothetical protein
MKRVFLILLLVFCLVIISHTALSNTKEIVVEETELVQLQVEAYDDDGDPLTYTFTSPLDEDGKWQTDYGDEGEYLVEVTVSDGKDEITETILIIVEHKNRAPVIEIDDEITADEGETVVIEPEIDDYEDDDIELMISEPVGDDGEWETGYTDAGEYDVVITADDGSALVEKTITLIVNDVNRIAALDEFYPKEESLEIEENGEVLFSIWTSDEDNDELSYIWEVNGENVLADVTEFRFTTDYDDSGVYEVVVEISDSKDTVSHEWTVNVGNINRAPVIDYISENIAVEEGGFVKIEFEAYDPDGEDLRYKVSEPVGNDLEWQTGYGDAGEYEVEVVVSDGELEASGTVNIMVGDVNQAPVFNPIEPVVMNEGELFELQLIAEDADGDEMVFSAGELPGGAELDEEGYFTYLAPYDAARKHWLFGSKKNFVITFTVTDGYEYVTQKLRIMVTDVNLAPELSPIDDMVVDEGDIVTIIPGVVDPDGDVVRIIISEPVGSDGVWGTHYAANGEYPITVTATDGIAESSVEFTITVNNVDRAPVIGELGMFEVYEGKKLVIEPVVSDIDGDAVELSAVNNLPGNASFEDGNFEWAPDYDISSGEPEEFTVEFTASDGEMASSKEAVIVVYNTNRKPVVLEGRKSRAEAYTGEPVLFVVDASDPDGDDLGYKWQFGVFTAVEGTNQMERTFTEAGHKKFSVIVSDGEFEAEQVFTVDIIEKPQPEPQQPVVKQAVIQQPAPEPEPKQETVVSGPTPTKTYYI